MSDQLLRELVAQLDRIAAALERLAPPPPRTRPGRLRAPWNATEGSPL